MTLINDNADQVTVNESERDAPGIERPPLAGEGSWGRRGCGDGVDASPDAFPPMAGRKVLLLCC